MSHEDNRSRLRHMLDYAQEAVEMVGGVKREALDQDRKLNLSLVRLLEVVGEAAGRIPENFRAEHPKVPWRDIADLRNRLIHGYDSVNFDVLWQIVRKDLPPLIENLKHILEEKP